MKTMQASHGLEWGSDGSVYLDALPMPAGRPEAVTFQEVLDAVTGDMEWYNAADLKNSRVLARLRWRGGLQQRGRHPGALYVQARHPRGRRPLRDRGA